MVAARRRRTSEEEQIFEQSAAVKKRLTRLRAELDFAVEQLLSTVSDDAILSLARAAIGVRRDLDGAKSQLASLQARYEALRQRPTEDVEIVPAATQKRPSSRRPDASHPWNSRAIPPKR